MATQTGPTERDPTCETLAQAAFHEFGEIADYVWKTPRLIQSEFQLELAKLPAYFPRDPEMRSARWKYESRRLETTFPFMMSLGNLFGVLAVFEVYLLRLAHVVLDAAGGDLDGLRGNGATKWLEFLRSHRVATAQPSGWPQIDAALKIRNCLMHSTGALDHYRHSTPLRNIVHSRTFLDAKTRRRPATRATADDEVERAVAIIQHPLLGERIAITNCYPWLVCFYCRDYYCDLCESTATALASVGATRT